MPRSLSMIMFIDEAGAFDSMLLHFAVLVFHVVSKQSFLVLAYINAASPEQKKRNSEQYSVCLAYEDSFCRAQHYYEAGQLYPEKYLCVHCYGMFFK
jgi:hypothetical protein